MAATNISVLQAIELISSIIKEVETYSGGAHTVQTTLTLVENIIGDINASGVTLGDLTEIITAAKPFLGLVQTLTSKT